MVDRWRSIDGYMAPQKTITIREAAAEQHLIAMLLPVIESDPTACGTEVIAGGVLFAVEYDGKDVGAFLLRQDGAEVVIGAAAGKLPGISLLDVILPHIEATCGASWVRSHSARRGMAKQLAKHGYGVAEIVYRKGLNNGR